MMTECSCLPKSAGDPKLVAHTDDIAPKNRRANRPDLHVNVFNYLVRCCARLYG
jgi:hypothetical protein